MSSILQKVFFSFCFLLATSLPTDLASGEMDTLQMLHVLYRHGDRAPIKFYPNDPIQDKADVIWPEGLGQLTKKGKAMEYKLGLWLRKRYQTLVSQVFNPEEVNIISTDFDRTLMSAQCVLASFYFPEKDVRFLDQLSWMPIPVHTVANGNDMLLNVDSACPRMSEELDKLQYIPEIKKFNENYEHLFKELSQMSGLNLTSALDVDFLFDTLRIEKLYNQSIPDWAEKNYDNMKKITDFSFKMNTYTHELKRLRGGPLLRTMVENMGKKSHGDLPERKMLMFSAHDTTIACLLNTMGIFNDVSPPYAATVLVELHQKNAQYFVRTFYQNDSSMSSAPNQLAIPGCTMDCPLDKWISLLKNVTPDNWPAECHRPDPILDHYYIVSLTGLLSILGVLYVVEHLWKAYKRLYRLRKLAEGYEPFEEVVVVPSSYRSIGT